MKKLRFKVLKTTFYKVCEYISEIFDAELYNSMLKLDHVPIATK